MDIHRMKCFLRLAEELHFSRAAEKQCMAQSTMSQQIQNLEEELNVRLFIRNNRKVQLTAAGEYLKEAFSALLNQYEAVVHEVQNIAEQSENRLSIGYHGPFNWLFPHPMFKEFKMAHPDIELSLMLENWGDIPAKLLKKEIDIGFLERAELENYGSIESCFLYRDNICFAVHKSHPLAKKKILKEADIKNEAIVMVDISIGRKSIEVIHERLINGGIDIRKGRLMTKFESCMAMVSSGNAISPMPRSFKQDKRNEILYIDYENPDVYVDFYVAWQKDNSSLALEKFLRYIKKV